MEYFEGKATDTEPLIDNMTPTVTAPPILRISYREYWKIEDDISPTTGRVGLSWGTESLVSGNSSQRTALKVMAWNDATSSWDTYGGGTFSAGHTMARGTFVSATPLSFSQQIVTLGSTEIANPLPVTFLAFEGKNLGAYNQLAWETGSEKNSSHFVLEHSTDGELFAPIGTVESKGSESGGAKYRYIHESPVVGRNYYRLKQVDWNGDAEYHHQVVFLEVVQENIFLDFAMSPNPTNKAQVTLHIAKANDQPVRVRIMDLSGKVISEREVETGKYFTESDLTRWARQWHRACTLWNCHKARSEK